jgi:hypothetical protein
MPPEVPEASAPKRPAPPNATSGGESDEIPEHIRRMLEAAYT